MDKMVLKLLFSSVDFTSFRLIASGERRRMKTVSMLKRGGGGEIANWKVKRNFSFHRGLFKKGEKE